MEISFFRKKAKKPYFLILDVGNKWVRVLVVSKKDKDCKIIAQDTKPLKKFGVFDGTNFQEVLLKENIQEALEEIRKKTQKEPTSFPVILGMIPAILQESVLMIETLLKRPSKKIIEEREEEQIYQKGIEAAKKEAARNYQRRTGVLPADLYFSDVKILETKLAGYAVPGLAGYTGKRVEFRVLISFLPKFYLENFQENVLKPLKLNLQKISSLPPALVEFLKNEKSEAIFIEFGDELTQIFIIKDNQPEKIIGFEKGEEFFLESFRQKLGIYEERIKYLMKRYHKGILSEPTRKYIKDILSQPVQEWLYDLKQELAKVPAPLPSDILLFGRESFLPVIQERLEEIDWEAESFFFPPEIKILSPEDLKNIKDQTSSLKSPEQVRSLLLCYSIKPSDKTLK